MRILRVILLAVGGALAGYGLVAAFFAAFGAGNIAFLALGLPLLAWGIFWRPLCGWASSGLGLFALWCLRIGYAAFGLCLIVGVCLMAGQNAKKPPPGADAVIVLGAGLRGEEVSLTLKLRLDAALGYLDANPQALCVVSGGQGEGEVIPEAEAMRRYLERAGVGAGRILTEDRSTNTYENIAFSRAVLLDAFGREPSVVIATSDFHLFRGVSLARGAGFPEPQGLGGRSHPGLLPLYAVREVFGIAKDGLLGRFWP